MIGEKINGLLVLGLDEKKNNQLKLERKQGLRKNAPVYYLCQCDCGNILSLAKQKIKSRKSDGCTECNKKDFKQYVNQQIHDWYIMEYLGNKKYKCRCSCGNIKEVNCYNVLEGLSKNCGCIRKEKISEVRSINSLIGNIYGRLKVIDEIGKNKHGKTICKCLCECGNEVEVLSNSLRTNHTISCGCTKSLMPSIIKIFLEDLGYKVEMEKRVNLDNKDIAYISFDLYIQELNLAIEYDGEPHFKPIDFANKGIEWAIEHLELTQYRDNIKNQYCYQNDINILRIPYTRKDTYKELIIEIIEIIANND